MAKTKDELRKEATLTVEWESTPMIDRPLFVQAYIIGAEPREKRIAELEAQILGFEKEFDLQNKRIDKLKDELKKIRVAYIHAQVGNVIAGTDIDSLFEKMFREKDG